MNSDQSVRKPLIETRSLGVSYGGKPALRNVSLAIMPNQITAIIGPSGCGKSSLLQVLNRISDLTPGCSVSGEALFHGQSIYDPSLDPVALRRRVGMIFQKPNPFPLSIRKNVELALCEHGRRSRKQLDEITYRVLNQVGLWDEVATRLDAPANTLSGGQQQRLCIARALALEPEVLLFDEPCSALDPLASRVVEQQIQNLRAKTTIVIVTHNLGQARRIADHVAVFWYDQGVGVLAEAGPAAEIFERPQTEAAAEYIHGEAG